MCGKGPAGDFTSKNSSSKKTSLASLPPNAFDHLSFVQKSSFFYFRMNFINHSQVDLTLPNFVFFIIIRDCFTIFFTIFIDNRMYQLPA